MSIEQLLLFGLFALVALAEFVVRRLRSRGTRGQEAARDAEPPARRVPDVESREGPLRPSVRLPSPLPEVPVVAARATPPVPFASVPARGAAHPRPPLGSRADLRRAIVLMTVLGPPAAAEAEERPRPR